MSTVAPTSLFQPARISRVLILAVLLIAGLVVAGAYQLLLGKPQLELADLLTIFNGGGTKLARVVVLELRVPRLVLDVCAGAMLALAGLLMQNTLRNPLASPDLLGVSAGSSLVIAAITIFHIPVLFELYPVLAMAGGLSAGLIVLLTVRRVGESTRLVLVGAALVALLHALLITFTVLGSQTDISQLYLFLLGSMANRIWMHAQLLLPWALIGIPIALFVGRPLNLLQLGDEVATGLGLPVMRMRVLLLALAAGMVAAVVAVSGPIAYVSLVAPHLARRILKTNDSRQLLPIAALIGALILTCADLIAKNLFAPIELPIGVWTTIIGGPLLLFLIHRQLSRSRSDANVGFSISGSGAALLRRVGQLYPVLLLVGLAAIFILLVTDIAFGSVNTPPDQVLAVLFGRPVDPLVHTVVWDLRLPRALIAVLAGAMLALAGAILQGLTRNPLADPDLTAASTGGVFVAVLWTAQIVMGVDLGSPGQNAAVMATIGSLAAGGLVFAFSRQGRGDPVRLVLTGVLVSTIMRSFTSLVLLSHTNSSAVVLLWIIGSLNGRTWVQWDTLWPWAIITIPLALLQAGTLNTMFLGDEVAKGLGMRVGLVRGMLFFSAVLLTAGAVSIVGAIGFLGLVAPHLARRVVGQDARRLLPLTALLGAMLLLGADIVSRALSAVIDLPVGAVMAFMGAPFLIFLLRRGSRAARA